MSRLYPYEILVIIDPRPTEEDVTALLTKLQDTLKSLGEDEEQVLRHFTTRIPAPKRIRSAPKPQTPAVEEVV